MELNEIIMIGKDALVAIFSILILILTMKLKSKKTTKENTITEVEPADLEFTKEMLKESFITILNGIIKTGIPAEKTFDLMLSSLKKDKKEILKKGALEDEKNSENN